ncbi:MAG: hypothetical protein UW64_C0015G0004 [Microgenomates group bacterium GW2011_GWC1_44_37]|uniref:Uncharacterized protein n=1 Tax=Candidatus Collierbacteria bacterium GW2011_GWB2_44_22 TaxID=1618387 RepID=A0A0G1KUK3_9BACT|nr:MAG: hypothetical protein UW31_C0005G0094 [Candidatus Collierbacteria bacterium GW2011_GWA2_44_13]KKT51584.1 MAG: hypothetical protein UW44_C0010G0022 [Candidatus Collierbacteria bacterium GW2011_GWB2_44_22]KKT63035.1 MAG: hypothetical protein UW56_C0002G0020 [Candidatus Collierbacteria bacterium GW2011_GWD1_44_27]KKT65846.1 MAG: hypothetical protein UW58_C0018G0020 [Candidatus Collierbacteria bacterium GW2011_GWC2_44_30]KKT68580.1 MAG: hypothetical protein UW64_C0015G0004 [Microgenomates gr
MKEKGQGLVEYAVILVMIAIVVVAALLFLGPIIEKGFNSDFDNKNIIVPSNDIPAHAKEIAHPKPIDAVDVPMGISDYLLEQPRSYSISHLSCLYVWLPEGASFLYAAAPVQLETATSIYIQMPIVGSRLVTICAAEGISTEIYLWSK